MTQPDSHENETESYRFANPLWGIFLPKAFAVRLDKAAIHFQVAQALKNRPLTRKETKTIIEENIDGLWRELTQ